MYYDVAPHVGAWIETTTRSNFETLSKVAHHVGAWIETQPLVVSLCQYNMSHPMWVRGLKQPQGVASGAQA